MVFLGGSGNGGGNRILLTELISLKFREITVLSWIWKICPKLVNTSSQTPTTPGSTPIHLLKRKHNITSSHMNVAVLLLVQEVTTTTEVRNNIKFKCKRNFHTIKISNCRESAEKSAFSGYHKKLGFVMHWNILRDNFSVAGGWTRGSSRPFFFSKNL